jgi:hypothetical protein
MEFKSTDLGFMGTQHTDIVSTPYGHFWVDAKRGKIFKLDQNGKGLEIISEQAGNQPTNMKQWFREHLPMKILKYISNIDVDNKYKGIGFNMWWDDRESRLFITKRDYIVKTQNCIDYNQEAGFFSTCGEPVISCPVGYTYNEETELCEKEGDCLNGLSARVFYSGIVPYAGHMCNRARFNFTANGINIGIVNLNNAGGLLGEQIDDLNVIPGGLSSSRESILLFSQQNIDDIENTPQGSNTLNLALVCRDPQQPGGCHNDLAQIQLFQNGVVIYSGAIGANTSVNYDPCAGGAPLITTPPIITPTITPINFDNTTYFKDVSWTISYKPTEGSWNSYFDFKPDYSPYHNNFFQVGYNWGQDKGTLWNHLMNNNSFCVFQGRKYSPIIEFPIPNENVNKILNSISLNLEGRHYQNDWDFAVDKDKSFEKMFIYNPTNCSGVLGLNPQKKLTDNRNFPRMNGNIQEILFTSNEDKQSINYFFNRVVNQNNNIPILNVDENNIFRGVNSNAVKFSGKKVLERLKGESFIVHLEGNKDSRYNLILKSVISDETIYE